MYAIESRTQKYTPAPKPRNSAEGVTANPKLSERLNALTPQQRRVAEMLAVGLPDKAIAKALGIETVSAKQHAGGVLRRLGLRRRYEVPAFFHRPAAGLPISCGDLTGKHRDVLQELARGLTNKEIAAALGMSPSTVSGHLKVIFQAMGVGNRTEAVSLWLTLCAAKGEG